MHSRVLVIASTLKPVDDVRSYKKIAHSIAKRTNYVVKCIGNQSILSDAATSNIEFLPIQIKGRRSLKRLLLPFLIFLRLIKIKPSLLIITVPALIPVAVLLRSLVGTRLIYDVQENYFKNAMLLSPAFWKRPWAHYLNFLQRKSRRYFDQVWIAEKCYKDELGYLKPAVILENKAKEVRIERKDNCQKKLLFTGTVSRYSGIEEALTIFSSLQKRDPSIQFSILGQVHDRKIHKTLEMFAANNKNLSLNVDKRPVAHDMIIEAILSHDLGIISYQPNEVNALKMPTKLYEYSRYGLPFLIQKNTMWEEKGRQLGHCISINYSNPDLTTILNALEKDTFHKRKKYPFEETWEFEEEKLYASIKNFDL
ncbi:MAG: hypothetical protein AAF789_06320 [Bacteroidota bacterium]